MRPFWPIVVAFGLLLTANASATGTVQIQQRDGSVLKYTGVTMKSKQEADFDIRR